jgi:flavodoxin
MKWGNRYKFERGVGINRKKRGAVLIALVLILIISGCSAKGQQGSVVPPADSQTNKADSNTKKNDSSILIAYFSRVGNTDFPDNVDAVTSASINLQNREYVGNTGLLAKWIQEEVGGELFLIQTAETYPADYDETVERGRKENDEGARPALASHVENMKDYDVIFLGFPNWWYDMPMAVYSFLEEYDLSGKTVIPFCTSGGSQFSSALETIRKKQPNIELLEGLAVRDSKAPEAQASVVDWLKKLGFVQ